MKGIKIKIPKIYNAAPDKSFDDIMIISAIYPEIQVDCFRFRTIFREGGNPQNKNIVTLIASTIKEGKPHFKWWYFDTDIIPDFYSHLDNQKNKLKESFIEELNNSLIS